MANKYSPKALTPYIIEPMKHLKELFSPAILVSLAACFFYWIYLGVSTSMIIMHDAIGYEELGQLLVDQGWKAYIETGPNREPFYPFLISISMRIGSYLSISYQKIQVLYQFAILFSTQILTLLLLRKLKVNNFYSSCVILYLGFSPTTTNTALRLYSEILTYPFILLIVLASLCASKILMDTKETNPKKLIIPSVLLAITFSMFTFVKGIGELVFLLYIIPFCLACLISLINQNYKAVKKLFIFIIIFLSAYQGIICLYKNINKSLNGNFTITDRGAWALYGNTARRTGKLTSERFWAGIAFVPGWGFCHSVTNPQECNYWSYLTSDEIGVKMRRMLDEKNLNPDEQNKKLIEFAIRRAIGNPIQYAFFTGVETLKMYFWESAITAYVNYPKAILSLYKFKPYNYGIFFTMPILTFGAIIFLLIKTYLLISCYIKSKQLVAENLIYANILFFIVCFIAAYSIFFTLARYIYPLIPLYLISLAALLQNAQYKMIAKFKP